MAHPYAPVEGAGILVLPEDPGEGIAPIIWDQRELAPDNRYPASAGVPAPPGPADAGYFPGTVDFSQGPGVIPGAALGSASGPGLFSKPVRLANIYDQFDEPMVRANVYDQFDTGFARPNVYDQFVLPVGGANSGGYPGQAGQGVLGNFEQPEETVPRPKLARENPASFEQPGVGDGTFEKKNGSANQSGEPGRAGLSSEAAPALQIFGLDRWLDPRFQDGSMKIGPQGWEVAPIRPFEAEHPQGERDLAFGGDRGGARPKVALPDQQKIIDDSRQALASLDERRDARGYEDQSDLDIRAGISRNIKRAELEIARANRSQPKAPAERSEFVPRLGRGAELGTQDVAGGFRQIIADVFREERNPYIDLTAEQARQDIPRREDRNTQRRREDDAIDRGPESFMSGGSDWDSAGTAGRIFQMAKAERRLRQAREAAAGRVEEPFLGSLSRAAEDLVGESGENKAEIRERYKSTISDARDQEFWNIVADSLGQSAPTTGAAMLNAPFGLALMYSQTYGQARDEFVEARTKKGLPVNEDEAAEYAATQASLQTPLELVGGIPLAGAMAKSLKGMLKGKVTTSQMANWIQATVANLAKATAGETLITTPGQSVVDQLTAQEYGVRDPMSWGDFAGKTGQDMKVSLAQGLLMSGGSLAVGGTGRTARSWLQSAHAEPRGNAAAVSARGAQLVILREERGRIVMALASTGPESARAQELVERLGHLDTQIARVEVTGAKAMRDHLMRQASWLPESSSGKGSAGGAKPLFEGRRLSDIESKRRREAAYFDKSILLEFGKSIYRADMDFVDWSVGMIKRFGEKVTPQLGDVWESLLADANPPPEAESSRAWVYPGVLRIRPMLGLTPEQREVEARFAKWVEEDLDRATREYAAIRETEGGRVIDVDETRKLSVEYNADKQSRTRHTLSVNKVAGAFVAKRLLPTALRRLRPGDVMGLTAGGSGSGKSEIKTVYPREWNSARFVYDGGLRRYSVATDIIESARTLGAKTAIWYVHVPVEQAVLQAMNRAENHGRVIPLKILAQSHFEAQRTIRRLLGRYANDPDVEIRVIDNSKGTPEIVETPLIFLTNESIKYGNEEAIEIRARRAYSANIEAISSREARSIFEGRLGSQDGSGGME